MDHTFWRTARSGALAQELKPELASLKYFQGSWACEGRFVANGRPISAAMTFAPELDGAWLAHRLYDRPPNPFHALELWGYDKTARQFESFIHDNFGGVRLFTSPGWTGDRLVWTGDALTPDAKEVQHFIFERKSQSEVRDELRGEDGEGRVEAS